MKRIIHIPSRIGVALAALFCATITSAEIILSDNFEDRTVGSLLQLSATSGPDNYTWHNVSTPPTGPVIGEYNGNKYANITGSNLASSSFSSLVIDSSETYTLSFDLLWLHNYGASEDSTAFFVYFNLPARYTNVPATNHAQGFRLGINPKGVNAVDYFIQQKSTGFLDVVRGSASIAGAINTSDTTTPGNPIPVTLSWNAGSISLSVGGAVVYDSAVTPYTPTSANSAITGLTYLQFWSTAGRNKGIDNVVLRSRYGGIEDLGAPLASATTAVVHGTSTIHQNGHAVLCTTVSGDPAKFQVFDLEDQVVLRSFDIPKGKTFWVHGADSAGDVFFAGYLNATLYRYSVADDQVFEVGPLFGEQAACALTFDDEDNVYIGTYPNAKIIKYDRATNSLVNLTINDPQGILTGEKYIKSLVHHDGYLYGGGMKENPAFFRLSLATSQLHALAPAPAAEGVTAYYYASKAGDLLFYNCSTPGGKSSLLIYDLAAASWLNFEAKQFNGLVVSQPMHGKVYYVAGHKPGQSDPTKKYIWSFDLATRIATSTDTVYTTGFRGDSVVTLSATKHPGYNEPCFVNPFSNGKIGLYNFRTGAAKTLAGEFAPTDGILSKIAATPDGRVMAGQFMGGKMVFLDPATRQVTDTISLGQAESALSADGKVYYGVYPTASVEVYDPSLPPAGGGNPNPRVLFDLKDPEHQSRPFGLARSGSKLVAGMVADYGVNEGALGIYDFTTTSLQVLQPLSGQNYTSLVTGPGGLVYGATSIHGGLGGTPVATAARLFILDPATGSILLSRAPGTTELGIPAPAQALGGLAFGPDGLLWAVSYGLVAAFDPVTLAPVRHVAVRPTNWLNQGVSWGQSSLDFTAEGLIVCNPGKTLVLLNPDDMTWSYLLPQTHTGQVSQSVVAPNGDIYFRSDLPSESSRLFRLPRLVTVHSTPESASAATPYETYLADAGVPEGRRGATDDPDGDGISNLLEYALGLDPMNSATNGLPVVGIIDPELTLTYFAPRPDLLYSVETTGDLADAESWTTHGVDQGTPAPGDLVTARVTLADTPRRFLRLSVTLRP